MFFHGLGQCGDDEAAKIMINMKNNLPNTMLFNSVLLPNHTCVHATILLLCHAGQFDKIEKGTTYL